MRWHQNDVLKTVAYLMAGWGVSIAARAMEQESAFRFVGYYFVGLILPLAAVALALEVGRRDAKQKPEKSPLQGGPAAPT